MHFTRTLVNLSKQLFHGILLTGQIHQYSAVMTMHLFFNRMLGYNTAFYDLDTMNWYWEEVNSKSATCYIKYQKNHFEYIQPLSPHQLLDPGIDSFVPIKNIEVVIPTFSVFPSAPVLEGIVKHIIPLYTHVMLKVHSIVKIHPTTNVTKKDEFQIKTDERLKLPHLRQGKVAITDHVDFSKKK